MTKKSETQILVVDDSPGVRDLLQTILEGAGYAVLSAADGRQALTIIHTQTIDLAVVDLYLPGLNGYALCAELKKKDAPVVFMSAALGPEERQCAAALGASAFLRKPFDLSEIETIVQQTLLQAHTSHPHDPVPAPCPSNLS